MRRSWATSAVSETLRRWLPQVVVLVVVAAGYFLGVFEPVERELMDTRFGLLQRHATGDVVVVEIDSRSLGELHSWPWPRTYHAQLLDTLLRAGATDVAFAVDFSSTSSTDADRSFAAALTRAGGRVILPAFAQVIAQPDGARSLSYTFPAPLFRSEARIGTANVIPGPDSLVRRFSTAVLFDQFLVPSTPALLLSVAPLGEDNFYVDFGIRLETVPRLSYVDVLKGQVDPVALAGKKIIVGATAVELGDQVAVPLHRMVAGPLLQALAYESLTQHRALHRTGSLPTLGLMVFVLVACAGPLSSRSWRRGLLVLSLAATALWSTALAVQAAAPVSVDIAPPLTAAMAIYVIGLVSELERQSLEALKHRTSDMQRRAMMQGVLEDSFDGIVIVGEDGTVEIANPAAARILGLDRDAIPGKPVDLFLPGVSRMHARAAAMSEPKEGRPPDIQPPSEFEIARPDGTALTLELVTSCSRLRMSGGRKEGAISRLVFIHTFRDISGRKMAEERLRNAMQEALAANRAKTEFLANMSHELRTPLNAIIGFSQIIERETFGHLANARYREYAGDIAQSGSHLLAIINDILDVSMIESGHFRIQTEPLDLPDVIGRCLKLVGQRAVDQGLRLVTALASGLPFLDADVRLLKQIVLNLLSNAIKFTPAGGVVTVSAGLEEGAVVLRVSDTGIGIPDGEVANVVKPFYQVEGALTRRHEGAGLGLALVSSYLGLHGGVLAIDSAVGRGTVVTVRFPAGRTRASRTETARRSSTGAPGSSQAFGDDATPRALVQPSGTGTAMPSRSCA